MQYVIKIKFQKRIGYLKRFAHKPAASAKLEAILFGG